MPKHGKNHRAAVAVVAEGQATPSDALRQVKDMAYARFDESVDAAVRLGVDPRKADQVVRGTVILPSGTGRTVRVLALVQGDKVAEATEAGADYVGTEYIEQIEGGWFDFDVAVATPDLMKDVAKLGRILGPRGLMPTPKAGTVTMDVGRAVREAKAGKIEFRVDRTGNIHAPIGKVSFELDQLIENFDALMLEIVRLRPAAAKGRYVRSVTVSSTMGPGISVSPDF
ncbi:MAG: 50S ribosomal protein L1 [Gemmatimonadota bacterium]